MRLPGFGGNSPLMPGLGGLFGGKPAFYEKIGDPGDVTGKIFRKVGISQAPSEPLLPTPPPPPTESDTALLEAEAKANAASTSRGALLIK